MENRPVRTGAPGQPPFRRRGRIVLSLLAVFAIVGLVPLGSVAWKLIDINKEALKTSHQEFQLLLASSIAREVDTHVSGLGSQLLRVSRTLGSGLGHGRTFGTESIRRTLADVADDRMLYLRFTDLRGRTIATTSASVPPDLEPIFVAGFREAAESLADRPRGSPPEASISEPILVSGDPPRCAVVVSTPVFSRGSFRGVLAALVDLQSVWEQVVGHYRQGHVVFALDARGRPFASNDLTRIAPGLDLSHSPIVQRFISAPGRATETMPYLWKEGERMERHLGSYAVTTEGWGIFVQAKERLVYLPVRDMVQSTLTWALAALSFAILAAVLFAGKISNPINRLAAASRAFAAGDFSTRVVVPSRNEIGELADTFNRMAAHIEDYIRRLRRAAEENNELFLGTIRALAQAIDAKDPYTRGHSVRVNRYAVIVARYLGLDREKIREIHVASLLHDVGKIGIDDSILKKPAPLTQDEFKTMKQHPVLGANIMAPIRQMTRILPGLRNHHERWVGGGYPDGLSGEAIPLMARIIAVADTFDAMTTDRPYQRAMTLDTALARLNDLRGVALDERVVDAFNRAFRAGEFARDETTSASERLEAATA